MPRHRVSLDDLRGGAGFLGGLPGLLRRPISLAEAQATRRAWLGSRESDFLQWREAGIPRVERQPPRTASGKILHLHVQPARNAPSPAGG